MSLQHRDPSRPLGPARHRRLESAPRRRWRTVALATVVAFCVGAPTAGAVWFAGIVVDADDISRGQVGFRLTQWDSTGVPVQDVAATSFSSPTSFGVTLTAADAAAIIGTPPAAPKSPPDSIAIPIRVESLAEGNGGLRYSFAPAAVPSGNLLSWDLYSVGLGLSEADGLAGCTPSIAGTGSPHTPGAAQSPVAPVPADDDVVSDWWCLVVSYNVANDSAYSNTAVASAEGCTSIEPNADGPCPTGAWTVPPAQASWSATVRPTPSGQPNITLPLTYVIVRPGG